MEVLALIPARGGSKSIPRKNIKRMNGFPLIAYSIVVGLEARLVDRVIVSTDDDEIASVAREWGADVPFMRPAEIAQDFSTDLEAFQHALTWLAEHEQYEPDICVHLRPTYPVRKSADIDQMVQLLQNHPQVDSVRSVAPAQETPFKMWFIGQDEQLSPVIQTDIHEAYNQPRQVLPPVYVQNASIDVTRRQVIMEMNSMNGQRIWGYRMEHNFDIDTEDHFKMVEAASTSNEWSGLLKSMQIRSRQVG